MTLPKDFLDKMKTLLNEEYDDAALDCDVTKRRV